MDVFYSQLPFECHLEEVDLWELTQDLPSIRLQGGAAIPTRHPPGIFSSEPPSETTRGLPQRTCRLGGEFNTRESGIDERGWTVLAAKVLQSNLPPVGMSSKRTRGRRAPPRVMKVPGSPRMSSLHRWCAALEHNVVCTPAIWLWGWGVTAEDREGSGIMQ